MIPARGQVTRAQRTVLEMEWEFLLGELDCKVIVPSLRSKGVLDSADEENIRGAEESRNPRKEQNSRLLNTIMNRTPAGFEALLATLRENNFDQAYRRLSQTLRSTAVQSDDANASMTQPTMRLSSLVGAVSGTPRSISHSSEMDGLHCQRQHTIMGERVANVESRVDDIEYHLGKLTVSEPTQTDIIQRNQEEIDRLTRELDDTKKEVERIQVENEKLSDRLAATSDELDKKIQKISSLQVQIKKLEKENEQLRDEIRRLHKQVKEVKEERDKDRKELREVQRHMEKGRRDLEKMQRDREDDRKMMSELTSNFKNFQQQLISGQQSPTFRPNNGNMRTNFQSRGLHSSINRRVVPAEQEPFSITGQRVLTPNTTKK